MRTFTELKIRAAVLSDPRIPQELRDQVVELAAQKSPSAIFKLAGRVATLAGLGQMEALGVAKAARWLAVIRRDYGQKAFDETVKTLAVNSTPTGTNP